ncbi:MAG: hypothetical protein F7C34_05070 [Desulfurococcales archaeon]|nr:hypothetical protein [Desulfurococcales archaeon]
MTRPATSGARKGSEKEEPREPPPTLENKNIFYVVNEPGGYVRILGGAVLLGRIEGVIKEPFYHYNSLISNYGYYVKPVHKVYKRRSGAKIVYVYYGRYWFRRMGSRLIYAGSEKPFWIPYEPPENPVDGVTLIMEGTDLLVNKEGLSKLLSVAKSVIPGLSLLYRQDSRREP